MEQYRHAIDMMRDRRSQTYMSLGQAFTEKKFKKQNYHNRCQNIVSSMGDVKVSIEQGTEGNFGGAKNNPSIASGCDCMMYASVKLHCHVYLSFVHFTVSEL